jgi:ABC-2 type transport system ATP-binding protein
MTRIELAGIVKSYGPRRVLDRAWLNVRAGETVGLIGANGAGKTTLLRIAAGLVFPDEGLVRCLRNGGDPIVRYFGGEHTIPPSVRGWRWASLFGAQMDECRLLGQLSRGSRQLFGLRVALARHADVFLLDEPWEGLDPNGSAWLTETVRQWEGRGAALLISSHRLHDLSSACSRVVFLENGRCQEIEAEDGGVRVDRLEQVFTRP